MPNVINKMMIRELSDAFHNAQGMLIVSMTGLTVSESDALRSSLADHGVRLLMVRNRLASRAMSESGHEPPEDLFFGNVGLAWGTPEDAIHAAKVMSKSVAKKLGKLSIRGGLLEGNLLGAEEADHLATLPGKDELRAMLLGVVSGPARSLVGLLAAPQGALVRVIQAHIDSAASGSQSAASGSEPAASGSEPASIDPAPDGAQPAAEAGSSEDGDA